MLDVKCKLYRFVQEANEWKERGVGQSRILQHTSNKRCRYLMREEKTLKIRANHLIMPGTQIQEHGGNDKALVFNCVDFADEEMKPELFCVRFASAERAQEFKRAYEAGGETNEPLLKPKEDGEEKDGEDGGPSAAEAAEDVADDLAKAKITS